MDKRSVAVGILAGGKSRRMGNDKAFLPFGEQTFLEKILEQCQDFSQIYLSVAPRNFLPETPYPLVVDEREDYGPLEGIYQILRASKEEYVLILATDMPFITRELLIALAEKLLGKEDCLVLRKQGRPEPLCSVYSRKILPVLEQMRLHEEHRLISIFDRCLVRYIDLETMGISLDTVENVNTVEEYLRLPENKGVVCYEDLCGEMERLAQQGEVCVCYLDGLGWTMYQAAQKAGAVPFLSRAFSIWPIRTVEPAITNAAMATMLTGVGPEIHGIKSHRDRELAVPTLFSRRKEDTVFLEGDTEILRTEIRPLLHTSKKGCFGDAWIVKDVKEALLHRTPFVFAHFHGIDDMAHRYGPYHENTIAQIREVDQWLEEISVLCQGTLLIVSDHGLYEEDGRGSHGRAEGKEDRIALWGMLQKGKAGSYKKDASLEIGKERGKDRIEGRLRDTGVSLLFPGVKGIPAEKRRSFCIQKGDQQEIWEGYEVRDLIPAEQPFDQMEFIDSDGLRMAVSVEEIQKEGTVWLANRRKGVNCCMEGEFRLVFPGDCGYRRWRKGIKGGKLRIPSYE